MEQYFYVMKKIYDVPFLFGNKLLHRYSTVLKTKKVPIEKAWCKTESMFAVLWNLQVFTAPKRAQVFSNAHGKFLLYFNFRVEKVGQILFAHKSRQNLFDRAYFWNRSTFAPSRSLRACEVQKIVGSLKINIFLRIGLLAFFLIQRIRKKIKT